MLTLILEIVVLIILCSSLGVKLRAKGRKPIGYQIGLCSIWFGVEITIGVACGLFLAIQNPGGQIDIPSTVYFIALGSAAIAASFVFLLVHFLPEGNSAPGPFAQYAHEFGTLTIDDSTEPISDNPYQSPRIR